MASVTVERLTKRYGTVTAVDDISLLLEEGELFGLLGPSGSGKTTFMRCIAGFISADAGRVLIGEEDQSGIPTYRRDIGMVFQNYALFPHMTIAQNIGFSLRVRRKPKPEIAERVEAMLRLVRLEGLGKRRPSQLSGGQQQRVALARAIVSRPRVLLLDEPLNALDKALRQQMQIELKQIQREVGITTVFVTHDQDEALALCDRIAIFEQGRIAQMGRPADIYEHPASLFAAKFLGVANQFSGRSLGTNGSFGQVALDDGSILLTSNSLPSTGARLTIIVRPEKMLMAPSGRGEASGASLPNSIAGKVQKLVYLGSNLTYIIETAVGPITVYQQNRDAPMLDSGAEVIVSWAAEHSIVVE